MKDYIVGISGLVLSLYVYLESKSFEQIGEGLSENPAYYPRILSLLLAVMSLGLLIGTFRKRSKIQVRFNWELLRNLGKFMGVLVIYIIILKPVGFIIGTAAFVFGMIWLLGGTKKQAVIYALPISLFVYLLFSFVLKVPLPKGILNFI